MKILLAFASAAELLTGLALMAVTAGVATLLFGGGVTGPGAVMSRVAGISLIALGLACWPARDSALPTPAAAVRAMTGFNLLMTSYLVAVGIGGTAAGVLLWPAAGLHALLTALLLITARRVGDPSNVRSPVVSSLSTSRVDFSTNEVHTAIRGPNRSRARKEPSRP